MKTKEQWYDQLTACYLNDQPKEVILMLIDTIQKDAYASTCELIAAQLKAIKGEPRDNCPGTANGVDAP